MGLPLDQARLHSALDVLGDRSLPELEKLTEIGDPKRLSSLVGRLDREQEVVAFRCEPGLRRHHFRSPEESPQLAAKRSRPREVALLRAASAAIRGSGQCERSLLVRMTDEFLSRRIRIMTNPRSIPTAERRLHTGQQTEAALTTRVG